MPSAWPAGSLAAGRAVAVTGGLGLVFIVMTALRVIHGG